MNDRDKNQVHESSDERTQAETHDGETSVFECTFPEQCACEHGRPLEETGDIG